MTASSGFSVPVIICSLICLIFGLVLWMGRRIGGREGGSWVGGWVGWVSRENQGEMCGGGR